MSVFGLYSRYYDLLYRDKDYQSEAAFVIEQIESERVPSRDMFELGCGTGMHALLFAKSGFRVHGIDFSQEMLAAAQQRCGTVPAEVAARLAFASGDVRTYRYAAKFGAVVSLFHVFSYQTTNADLSAAFATAAEHMQPGSLLAFDFWYGPAVLAQRPEVRVKRFEDDRTKVLRISEPTLHSNENRVDVHFTVFVEDKATGQREELRETHPMRYLFMPELDLMLDRAGMTRVRGMEWLSGQPLSEKTWGGFVLARKEL